MLCALCDLCVQRDSFTSPLGLLGPAAFGSPKGLMTKYDVERRTRRTRRKTLSIFLCGFRGFCVVRDSFTRSEGLRYSNITMRARPSRLSRPSCPRRAALEVCGRQIELAELHRLVRAEADAFELRRERRRVADEHHRQAIGTQELARDALDVVDADRVHALAERLELFERQTVEQHVDHLHRDRLGRLDRQREAAGEV